MKNQSAQKVLGFVLLILVCVWGFSSLGSSALIFRLLIGLALGYALSRAFMGFAGSVNRAYTTGSTKLMRALMYLFVISAVITAGLKFSGLLGENAKGYNLWVNPINLGLIIGGLLFGFGMAFASCCASGVLTDMVTELPKAFVTLIFFGIGVFVGFPIQATAPWVRKSWFNSATALSFKGGKGQGVFLPDLFPNDQFKGYFSAILITLLFAGIVVLISYLYEAKRKKAGTLSAVPSESEQAKLAQLDFVRSDLSLGQSIYYYVFVKPWSLLVGASVIAVLYLLLMTVTGNGWGASTPYGMWFGKLLNVFGVPAASLAEFAKKPAEFFTNPLLQHGVTLQNIGIILGTLFYMLTSGKLLEVCKNCFKLQFRDLALFAMAGLAMGFGTRLSNGCNVGALYTPIANFSLAGWIYLIFISLGCIIGNMIRKKIYSKV